MNVKEENICRLCLRVAKNDFKIIDENTRKIFEALLLRMNLDISKDPIICKDCAEITEKCYSFKSVCNDTEKLLMSFITDSNVATLELIEAFKNGKDVETVDGKFICLFCSNHLSRSNLVLLETLTNDITFAKLIKVFLPLMDFDIIKNPLICTTCKENFECYIKFVENCLDVEYKITKYFQNEATSSSVQVKLSEILRSDSIPMYTIKKEENEFEDISEEYCDVYDGALIKSEEDLVIKDERLNFSETRSDGHKFNIPCRLKAEIHKGITEMEMSKCSVCAYETKYKKRLNSHMSIHKDITEVKMYKCSMCNYVTRRKGNLNIHMVIHKDITEVEMYKCSICDYETRRKGALRTHMLNHKDITEVKMYKCSMCDYETKHKEYLKIHMIIHKDITEVAIYKCSMCAHQSKHKRSLNRHMLVHKDITEEEMYKCSMCTFRTKHKIGLKNHMLVHKDITEVKMYKCSMCTFDTKYKNSLKKHLLLHKDHMKVARYKCSLCTYETKNKKHLKKHVNSQRHLIGGNV